MSPHSLSYPSHLCHYLSLLREIQDSATEAHRVLGSLLRKVKLLASRIGVKEIGEWAQRELSGYDGIDGLPPYRGPLEAVVLGHGADMVREYRDTFLFPQ